MAGIELDRRYRAGRDGVRVIFRDGSKVQLEPFASIRFDRQPLKIVGRLFRAGAPGAVQYEAPSLNPDECK